MRTLLSSDELKLRAAEAALSSPSTGEFDQVRVEAALRDATGIIVMHCPFLLGADGELLEPLPAQFAEGLRAVCADIAVMRLSDTLRGSEEAQSAYKASIRMLERINEQQSQTLAVPAEQTAELVGDDGELLELSGQIDCFWPSSKRSLW